MPHFRHIISDNPLVPAMTFTVDENRVVLRFLEKRTEKDIDLSEAPITELSTTEQLSSPQINRPNGKYYVIDGEEYIILAEGVLDKTSSMFQKDWVPGAHFVFHFDPLRGFFIDSKATLTYFNKRNTADHIRYSGGLWLLSVWVRDQNAPVTECARSLTTGKDMVLITNVEDLGEQWEATEVMKGKSSQWLNLGYELIPSSESVEPEGWVDFTLKIKDGKTGELATDVTWDGFIVEPVDGYSPHRRVPVTNGIGHFRMKALGLRDGEFMRVKINHRFYTSRVEAIVPVVAAND